MEERGYFKSFLYNNHSKTLGEMKHNVHAAIANINEDMLDKLDQSFRFPLFQCIDQTSGRFQNIIFMNC